MGIIYLSLLNDPAAHWTAYIQPVYMLQDLAAFLLFLALCLVPGFAPGFFSRPLFRAFLGAFCFLVLGLASISALRYFAVYELHFQWSHLDGGSQELWHSVRNEIDAMMLVRVALLLLLTGVWTMAAKTVLPGYGGPLKSPDTKLPDIKSRAIAFAAFFVPGLVLAFALSSAPAAATEAFETRRERAHNIPLRLIIPYRVPQKITAKSKVAGAGEDFRRVPFSYEFSTNSLTDTERKPRLDFPDRGRKRNIVLYIFESTTAAYVGTPIPHGPRKGQSVTPAWDRLTRNAWRFRNHYAQNPLSVNALFSMLVSAYGMPADRWAATEFPRHEPMGLVKILRENGYRTALLHPGNLKYARQNVFLKHRGFDMLIDAKVLKRPPYTELLNWGIDDRAFIEPAVKFARDAREKGKPFFMILQPVSPHHPYEIPDEKFRVLPERSSYHPRRGWYYRYLSSLHYSDFVLGRTVEEMEKAGFADDTLFIVLADHGEAFGQHRRNYNHPFYVYQENVHVPFIIYNRKLFKKTRDLERITRHIDLAPTVLDLLGIKGDSRFQGRSVLRAGPPVMAPFRATWRNDIQGLRDGKWKFIHNRRTGRRELYDLSLDPAEKNNLIDKHPELSNKYHDYLVRLTGHQKRYFEHSAGKRINWRKRREYTE